MQQGRPALDPIVLRYRIVVLVFLTIMSGMAVTNLIITTILTYHLLTQGIHCANLPRKAAETFVNKAADPELVNDDNRAANPEALAALLADVNQTLRRSYAREGTVPPKVPACVVSRIVDKLVTTRIGFTTAECLQYQKDGWQLVPIPDPANPPAPGITPIKEKKYPVR